MFMSNEITDVQYANSVLCVHTRKTGIVSDIWNAYTCVTFFTKTRVICLMYHSNGVRHIDCYQSIPLSRSWMS